MKLCCKYVIEKIIKMIWIDDLFTGMKLHLISNKLIEDKTCSWYFMKS